MLLASYSIAPATVGAPVFIHCKAWEGYGRIFIKGAVNRDTCLTSLAFIFRGDAEKKTVIPFFKRLCFFAVFLLKDMVFFYLEIDYEKEIYCYF